ncbi:MAG: hypothetical protein NZM44_04410 [Candidatus Calescibacterium sp.]|nr:hypothetical protein [Candidatus Calescibacterium sp.]
MKSHNEEKYLLELARDVYCEGWVYTISYEPVVVYLGKQLGKRKANYLFCLAINYMDFDDDEDVLGWEVQGFVRDGDRVLSSMSPNDYRYTHGGYLYKAATERCWELEELLAPKMKKITNLRNIKGIKYNKKTNKVEILLKDGTIV